MASGRYLQQPSQFSQDDQSYESPVTGCTLWQDTGGQSLYRVSPCIPQNNCIHPKSCIWEAIPNFISEVAFSKHTFRHLLFGHESTYLVAVLLYDQESACLEHKSIRDAKFRMIFQEKLQKIDHLLPQPCQQAKLLFRDERRSTHSLSWNI